MLTLGQCINSVKGLAHKLVKRWIKQEPKGYPGPWVGSEFGSNCACGTGITHVVYFFILAYSSGGPLLCLEHGLDSNS